ncbi:predicted protein [Nematostella vectensis]|uniref:F5/8 type C domain-containing protein n=1 Tax=Nematostella vectensis TaxID=45351 RepID=A7STZ3_NEMVE|nr:predicted protein [Nematostella vectensis]|eukprot:XP_001624930.1 predicted protein [Nematostella vectensis]
MTLSRYTLKATRFYGVAAGVYTRVPREEEGESSLFHTIDIDIYLSVIEYPSMYMGSSSGAAIRLAFVSHYIYQRSLNGPVRTDLLPTHGSLLEMSQIRAMDHVQALEECLNFISAKFVSSREREKVLFLLFHQACSPFLQVDLGSEKFVTKVSTQGDTFYGWVTKYKLKALKGGSWSWYRNSLDEIRYFDGNYDSNTVVSHHLLPSAQTRYIRIYPVKVNSDYYGGLRVDFFGCPIERENDMMLSCCGSLASPTILRCMHFLGLLHHIHYAFMETQHIHSAFIYKAPSAIQSTPSNHR